MRKKARFLRPCNVRLLALLLTLTAVGALTTIWAVSAATSNDASVRTPYLVDASDPQIWGQMTRVHAVTAVREGQSIQLAFEDCGEGVSDDPYFSLPLPAESIDCTDYPYFAMLITTDQQQPNGELRFQTTQTGSAFPCQFFSYEATAERQLIIVRLTDRNSVHYVPDQMGAFSGVYTHVRLDPFNNQCPVATNYFLHAYGFFATEEDAQTLSSFEPAFEADVNLSPALPDIDYTAFWRGEAFAVPSLDTRIRWVGMGYRHPSIADQLLMQGYGGFVSNVVPDEHFQGYLQSPEDLEELAKIFDRTASLGMNVWIYDEYQWPSGKAFGLVLEGHDEFQAKGIEHKTILGNGGMATYELTGTELSIMEAVLTDEAGTRRVTAHSEAGDHPERISEPTSGAWTLDVYVLRHTYDGVEDPTDFETLRHVDLLNPEAVARFIRLTYDTYYEALGERRFANVEAFFTDEPQLGNRGMTSYIVWTDGLEERFRATYGYDLDLPCLFSGNSDEARMVRLHYYSLVATLFRESYTEQLTAWCTAHGVASSGHFLFEEDMNDHIETYGGDFLQFVGAMTIPGADVLWVDPVHLLSQNQIGNYMGLRYVASAAKNAGKPHVMIEFNPSATIPLTPENTMIDSLGGLSITRLLGVDTYTIINPSFDYSITQSNLLNAYIGRLNTLLEGAVESGDLAVFYPIATVQALHHADMDHSSTSGSDQSDAVKLNTRYESLCLSMLNHQLMYTFLDDQSLCAATVTEDGRLLVGQGAYRVLVLPYTQYISVEALERLVQFQQKGGQVVFVGDRPVHGLAHDQEEQIAALMAQLSDAPYYSTGSLKFLKYLDQHVSRHVQIKGNRQVTSHLLVNEYQNDQAQALLTMLVNTDTQESTLTLSYTDGYDGSYIIYDPLTGVIETLSGASSITIPPCASLLVVRGAESTHNPEESETWETPVDAYETPSSPTSEQETNAESTTSASSEGCKAALPLSPALFAMPMAAWMLRRRERSHRKASRL